MVAQPSALWLEPRLVQGKWLPGWVARPVDPESHSWHKAPEVPASQPGLMGPSWAWARALPVLDAPGQPLWAAWLQHGGGMAPRWTSGSGH